MADELVWTKEKPTKPGWYWIRSNQLGELEVRIINLRWYGGQLCNMNWPPPDNAEWAGPLLEPLEE